MNMAFYPLNWILLDFMNMAFDPLNWIILDVMNMAFDPKTSLIWDFINMTIHGIKCHVHDISDNNVFVNGVLLWKTDFYIIEHFIVLTASKII